MCRNCGISLNELDLETRRYGKIFYALSQMDLRKPSLLVNFLRAYCVSFPGERKELLHIFLRVTSFVTVDEEAAELFGSLYRIGRRGEPAIFQQELIAARRWKQDKLEAILCGTLRCHWTRQYTRVSGWRETRGSAQSPGIRGEQYATALMSMQQPP